MADVNVTDLTQETYESLDGNEQIIMFDSVEGKRATVKAVGDYILKKLALSGTSSIQDLLGNKVDKVTGKGLSANDFTTTLKTKLDGIESGAEENVQVDWSVTDSTSDAFIKNKPTIPSAVTVDSSFSSTSTNPVQNQVINTALNGKVDKVTGKSLSTNDFTSELKTKLEGIATGAEVNVQVDWNETNSGSDAFIKNKPTIPPAVTVDSSLSGTSTNPVQNQVINTALGNKVDKVTGKGLSTNDYTTNEKNKLSNIESGAEVNQNAFSQVKVGNTTIYADSKEDVVEFVAGNNINITPDATNDKLTIEGAYTNATKLADGLMSATDKENLDDAVDLIGNTTMGTTATTITGAIAEHESDISDLNSNTILYESSFTSNYGTFEGGPNENSVQINGNVVIVNARITITSAYRAWNGGVMEISGVSPMRYIVTSIGYGVGALMPSSNNSCEVQSASNYSVGEEVRITVVFIKN